MVSLVGCGGAKTMLTLGSNKTLHSGAGFGCLGTSSTAGPLSTLWRKPMAGGRTAVLAINGAALPAHITIDVAAVLAPDGSHHTAADALDVWNSSDLGTVTSISATVPSHGNIFVILSKPSTTSESSRGLNLG
jgi:hypothetical protein